MLMLKILLALAVVTIPANATPHLLASARGAGVKDASYIYLGGAYFPGKGYCTDVQSKWALYPGTRWQTFGLNGPGPSITTGAILPPDVLAGITAKVRQALPESDEMIAVANVGPGAQPRLPRAQNLGQDLYRKVAADLLRAKGLKIGRANLRQLLRVDLNGDGVEEVLLGARSRLDYGTTPEVRAGDYALLALRFVDGEQVKNVALDADVARKNVAFSAPPHFEVLACVDVDGDGKMEIIVSTGYYEGWGFEVWQFDGKGVRRVVEAGWGV